MTLVDVFRAVLLIVAIGLVYTAPMSEALHHYFRAQLVGTFATEAIFFGFGDRSVVYAVAYSVVTAWITIEAVRAVGYGLRQHPTKWMVAASSIALAAIPATYAWRGIHEQITAIHVVLFSAASLLAVVGIAVGMAIPCLAGRERIAARALCPLWMIQSAYFYGLVLHLSSPLWHLLNHVAPSWFVIATCCWLAWQLRRELSRLPAPGVPG